MKTILDLPEALVNEIKRRAATEGRDISEVVAGLLASDISSAESSSANGQTVPKKLPLIKVRPAQPSDPRKLTTQEWCDWIKEAELRPEIERYEKTLDINTWIALTLETHPHHAAARKWYDEAALTRGDLVFCLPTELGFLRLVTQAAVMSQCSASPLTNVQALAFLANVCNDSAVSRADEPPGTRGLWQQLAAFPQAAPNIWLDAYLAAFAISLGASLVTFDRGFLTYQKSGLNLELLESP